MKHGVEFDPITQDYAIYAAGQCIGYAATEGQAWERLAEHTARQK